MIQHTKLEQNLDALGGVIAAEGSVVEQVTERIDRLPHRPLKEAGAARRWMGRAALIVTSGLIGLAAGWYIPHESADAAAPLDRTGEPFTRAHAPSGVMGKSPVTQRDHRFSLISKPPEASLGSAVGVSAYFRQMEEGDFYLVPSAMERGWRVKSGRTWGPEQATGFPDTPNPGDFPTAWASLTRDGQAEWLELTYPKAVQPTCVLVFESYKPGAVHKVSVFDNAGKEVEVWTGKDPTSATEKSGVSAIRFTTKLKVDRVRIYLDSARIADWNEIDAVGLIDKSGRLQWASRATASSTYAKDQPPAPEPQRTAELLRRVRRLEELARELRKELEEMKK
jgi:hypothetical protein